MSNPTDAIDAATATGAPVVHDFTVWAMFMQADWVVQAVMIGLIVASIWCWAAIIEKQLRMTGLRRKANAFEDKFWSGGSLDELYAAIGKKPGHPMAALFVSTMREWRRSLSTDKFDASAGGAGLKQRLDRVADVTIGREMERLERNMSALASIGSVSPFVGLFGTVWGIMNAFQSIAQAKNTSLAVVAPGIAEALLVTAMGLAAAIPAVVAYNKFNTDLSRYADRLDGFAGELTAMLGRKLDERAMAGAA